MLWKDVIIDKGSQWAGQAASGSALGVKLTEPTQKGFEVSKHARAYWVCNVCLDMGMTVYKDTETGLTISMMLDEKKSGDEIRACLLPVFLANVVPDQLERSIECEIDAARKRGRREKAEEIRAALRAD